MYDRCYIGIDCTDNNEWIAVFCAEEDRMFAELARLYERISILEKRWSSTAGQGRPMATPLADAEKDAL
jgi:hypothetical protein